MRNCKIMPVILTLALLSAAAVAAQTARRKNEIRLPRVGTIKDYEATGLTAGCNNLYFTFPKKSEPVGEKYVFLSRPNGEQAWMNLDGRDVTLTQLRFSPQNEPPFRFYYRWRKVLIDVLIEDLEAPGAPGEESDEMFRMRIVLRRGRAKKTIRAVGSADC